MLWGWPMRELTITSPRIRPMVHADLALVLSWRNHPEVRRNMYTQHEITLNEHQRWFERSLPDPKKHLLIFEVNLEPLGFVNFNESENGGIAEWGFYVAPYALKGTGRQLGHAALSYAFNQVKFHKVNGQALAYNERSIHFHKSLGFEQEGILRDQHFDGECYHNVICFGMLFPEWQNNL